MTELRLQQISLSNYSWETVSGSITFVSDELNTTIKLTEAEARQLITLGQEIFLARQKSVADSIANIAFPALPTPAPTVVDAEFTEIPVEEPSDDIPF